MEIKILSLLSLIPFFYVIKKIIRKRDLNAFDVIITFETIYMAIIPLFGNVNDIAYSIVKTSGEVQILTFFIYNLFAYLLVFVDYIYSSKYKNSSSIINTTYYIRTWTQKNILPKNILIIEILIFAFLLYSLFLSFRISMLVGISSLDNERDMALSVNTPLTIFIISISNILRLFLVFILTVRFVQLKQKNNVDVKKCLLIIILLLIYHIQISRTYIFESCSFALLIYYSNFKDHFRKRSVAKVVVAFALTISLLFPIVTVFRSARNALVVQSVGNFNFEDFVAQTYYLSINSDKKQIENADNTNERSWNVYQIIALAMQNKYEGNGTLIKDATSCGLPKAIFPNKKEGGSQKLIENKLMVYSDIADSILLYGVVENRILGPFIACLFFILLMCIFKTIYDLFMHFFKNPLINILVLCSLYIPANRIEWTVDEYIPSIEHLILLGIIAHIILNLVFKNVHFVFNKKSVS